MFMMSMSRYFGLPESALLSLHRSPAYLIQRIHDYGEHLKETNERLASEAVPFAVQLAVSYVTRLFLK